VRSNLTRYGSSTQVRALTFGAGVFNLTGRAAKMAIASISQPMDQEENAIVAVADVYILSGAIYTRADGSWAPLTLLECTWRSQDQLAQSVELTNESYVKLLGNTRTGGRGYYIMVFIPNSSILSARVRRQLGSSLSVLPLNLSAFFNNAQLFYTMRINVSKLLSEQGYAQMNTVINP
jgi:hypothetical protein